VRLVATSVRLRGAKLAAKGTSHHIGGSEGDRRANKDDRERQIKEAISGRGDGERH